MRILGGRLDQPCDFVPNIPSQVPPGESHGLMVASKGSTQPQFGILKSGVTFQNPGLWTPDPPNLVSGTLYLVLNVNLIDFQYH